MHMEGRMRAAMMMEKMSRAGERNAPRMIIIKAFWMLDTSVVSRVTSEDAENRSMLENEKSCTR